jgi:hypothetical protein
VRNKIRPRITEEEYDLIKGIREQCEEHQVDFSNVPDGWLKGKHSSIRFKNPHYKTPEEQAKEIDFEKIIKEVEKFSYVEQNFNNVALFDRLVYTDVHIGMDVNPDGFSLYGGKWDKDELFKRLDEMIQFTLDNRKSEVLYIDELGDFMDGWDGQTVRREHHLPQNMDNQRAYYCGIEFKIKLIQSLIPYFKKIVCHNVCEDNHAGAFGYVVNSAFKRIADLMFDKVEVINQRKFINHYQANANHTFILTHGKDSKNLRFGFKPNLDKAQENKIDNYIKEHYLLKKGVKIEFSKGDSHQYIFDSSTSESFNYYNYPAFSPSSNWVQTNFQKGISGFIHFNYWANRKQINEYFFNWSS